MCSHGIFILHCHRLKNSGPQSCRNPSLSRTPYAHVPSCCGCLSDQIRHSNPASAFPTSSSPATATDPAGWPSWGLSPRGEGVEPSPAPSHLAPRHSPHLKARSVSSLESLPLAFLHFSSPPLNKDFEPLLTKVWTKVEITTHLQSEWARDVVSNVWWVGPVCHVGPPPGPNACSIQRKHRPRI